MSRVYCPQVPAVRIHAAVVAGAVVGFVRAVPVDAVPAAVWAGVFAAVATFHYNMACAPVAAHMPVAAAC